MEKSHHFNLKKGGSGDGEGGEADCDHGVARD